MIMPSSVVPNKDRLKIGVLATYHLGIEPAVPLASGAESKTEAAQIFDNF
jgi:hypothetical protein